ncbi:c-type cytochrome biogenesis protein CcmI [uncultured Thioclava sp.]|uniref:c-type cytochrome biogenesis protein CcmI n=1 Tax=uncultured Thioclava sp. TaxID=473858 RepID=UPI0025E8939E|nr:c-type cytochrome biogenesis protein CcmI [uncultured Thioclava sp.]
MLFWTIAAALVAIITLLFALAVMRGGASDPAPTASYDVQVYRDQLRDIERDVERGVTSREEAERAKLEISRRMLEADRKVQAGSDTSRAPQWAMIVLSVGAVALVGGAFWLYGRVGAEGYADQPIAERYALANKRYDSRPTQEAAEKMVAARQVDQPKPDPKFTELMVKLREAVSKKPNDPKGLELLARNEAAMGNFDAAWKAQQRLLALKGEAASADDYAQLGELMVVAAGGLVTPESEKVFATALQKDPENGLSLYYVGLMMVQNSREDRAFRIWDGLLRNSPDDAPWVPTIRQNINELAWLAGENDYTPPMPRGVGPNQADIAAAADMTPAERQNMIRGMVNQLNDRLAQEGGSADDWARLISSLRMLGEVDRANAIYGEAKGKFAAQPQDMAKIDTAHQAPVGKALEATGGTPAPAQGATQGAPMLPGPSAEQMKDAAQMSPADRKQMIQGMVDGLFDRLTTEGGTAAEWSRVVSSLATLGEKDRALEALGEAQQALASDRAALAQVQAAAQAAGLSQ